MLPDLESGVYVDSQRRPVRCSQWEPERPKGFGLYEWGWEPLLVLEL